MRWRPSCTKQLGLGIPGEKGVKRYKELIDSTMVVLIAMVLLGGFVAVWDFVFLNLMDFVTGL